MGFYIQDDMWEAVSELPRRQQDEVMGALVRLAYTGEATELAGAPRVAFVAFRDRVLLSVERSRNGRRGGKQSASKTEANGQAKPKQTAKQNGSKPPSKPASKTEAKPEPPIKEREGEGEELPNGSSRGRARFRAPAPEEAAAYAAEFAAKSGVPLAFDANRFCDYYASRGWKVGKAPMRDWRAAVRNWVRLDAGKEGTDDEDTRFAAYA